MEAFVIKPANLLKFRGNTSNNFLLNILYQQSFATNSLDLHHCPRMAILLYSNQISAFKSFSLHLTVCLGINLCACDWGVAQEISDIHKIYPACKLSCTAVAKHMGVITVSVWKSFVFFCHNNIFIDDIRYTSSCKLSFILIVKTGASCKAYPLFPW